MQLPTFADVVVLIRCQQIKPSHFISILFVNLSVFRRIVIVQILYMIKCIVLEPYSFIRYRAIRQLNTCRKVSFMANITDGKLFYCMLFNREVVCKNRTSSLTKLTLTGSTISRIK
jgi:hypothetical protein